LIDDVGADELLRCWALRRCCSPRATKALPCRKRWLSACRGGLRFVLLPGLAARPIAGVDDPDAFVAGMIPWR
jgi:hypothetical protein